MRTTTVGDHVLVQLLATVQDVEAPSAGSGLSLVVVLLVMVGAAFLIGYLLWRRSR